MHSNSNAFLPEDEIFLEEDFEEALYDVLASRYAHLSPEELDSELQEILGEMSLEELEDFFSGLKSGMQQAGKFFQQHGGAMLKGAGQGAAAGATVGGPWGALIGGIGGAALGGVQSATAKKPRHAPAGPPPAIMGPTVGTPAIPPGSAPQFGAPATGAGIASQFGASPATAQMIGAFLRPETLQALMSMMMGPSSSGQVMVGRTPVPVGAFANLIATLATRAAAQYNASTPTQGPEIPEYLLDSTGELKVDPASAEDRADALLELLGQQVLAEAFDVLADEEEDVDEILLDELVVAVMGDDSEADYLDDILFDD